MSKKSPRVEEWTKRVGLRLTHSEIPANAKDKIINDWIMKKLNEIEKL